MSLDVLNDRCGDAYDTFLKGDPHALFFASNDYRRFLRELLGAEDHYLLSLDDRQEIVGALPLFIRRNDIFGDVVNSLPFYGSNGGVLAADGRPETIRELMEAYGTLIASENCAAATMVTSPFEETPTMYERYLSPTFVDGRIGQWTPLPEGDGGIEEKLLFLYHPKTRNLVRKAMKSGFHITHGPGEGPMAFLRETHGENMGEIGGATKPDRFFDLIPKHFAYDRQYRIYTAYKGGEPAAALLLFYFHRTVEYFTPVVKKAYRADQPLSLLIHQAMADAAVAGYGWWNWGGTWHSQDGVYHFKKRWGTQDRPYFYYTNIRNPGLLELTKEQLLHEYPYFYVLPFDRLPAR